jgi:hypothetical protein
MTLERDRGEIDEPDDRHGREQQVDDLDRRGRFAQQSPSDISMSTTMREGAEGGSFRFRAPMGIPRAARHSRARGRALRNRGLAKSV